MKLSIIIPVFQVESSLRRCVHSVIDTQLSDYEILLIDDGSTDGSGSICDELAKQYAMIKVIHKTNGGLSDARNAGLDIAQGQYITFVDSDDFLEEGTYGELLAELDSHPDIDMVEFPVVRAYGSSAPQLLNLTRRTYTDKGDYWIHGKAYQHAYAWNKIYRRELFEGVRFPKGRAFEDVWTLPRILSKCRKVMTVDVGKYFYCYNPNGITLTAGAKEYRDLLEAHLSYINNGGRTDGTYYAHVLNIQMDTYERTGDEPLLPVMPYWTTYKLILLHIIGLKNLCKLNTFIHKLMHRHR